MVRDELVEYLAHHFRCIDRLGQEEAALRRLDESLVEGEAVIDAALREEDYSTTERRAIYREALERSGLPENNPTVQTTLHEIEAAKGIAMRRAARFN